MTLIVERFFGKGAGRMGLRKMNGWDHRELKVVLTMPSVVVEY